jgi:hypothetical protein
MKSCRDCPPRDVETSERFIVLDAPGSILRLYRYGTESTEPTERSCCNSSMDSVAITITDKNFNQRHEFWLSRFCAYWPQVLKRLRT